MPALRSSRPKKPMSNHRNSLLYALVLLFTAAGAAPQASQTSRWVLSTKADFLKGDLKGVSISSDGGLAPAPVLKEVFDSGEAFVYAAAADRAGNLYIGTGNNGRIFRVSPNGQNREIAKLSEAGVFALTLDSQDRLYAATSPDGKVYRIDGSGNATQYYDPRSKYIWSLAMDRQNNLYVGTGPRGEIHRVDPQGRGSVFYDSNETHITSLAWDLDGNLLAGTAPGALVLRISPQADPFVLYDSSLAEVKSLAIDRYGTIYAAALAEVSRFEGNAKTGKESSPANGSSEEATVSATGVKPGKGLEVYRIDREGLIELLHSADDSSGFDVLPRDDGSLLVATGPKGRILSLSSDRFLTILAQSGEEQVTSITQSAGKIYAAASNLGKVFELSADPSQPRTYESAVLDAKTPALWGTIRWQTRSGSSKLKAYTRAGNTDAPDATWSDWSAAYGDPEGSPVSSPPARYLQFKVEFPIAAADASFRSPDLWLERIEISYLQNNMAPRMVSLTVHAPGKAFAPLPVATGGGAPPGGPDGAHLRSLPRSMRTLNGAAIKPTPRLVFVPGARSFSWKANDPNQDDLIYTVFIRKEGEDEWRPLMPDIPETQCTIDGAGFADGVYFIKVRASDRLSNPPDKALHSEMVSKAFVVANTGPELDIAGPGGSRSLQFTARSGTASLHQAEYQIDGGEWIIILPEDGITDGRSETYSLQLDRLPSGERVVSVRVIDSVGNISTRRIVVEAP